MGPLCRSMGRRAQRRLRKNTARAMMTWLVASQVPTSAENQGSRDRDRDQDRHRHGRVHVQDLFSLWHHQQKTRVQEGVQVCQWPCIVRPTSLPSTEMRTVLGTSSSRASSNKASTF